MTDPTRGQLEKAFALIQDEKLNEATSILRGVITKQPNNGDAWWLMANAVTEPEDAYEALSNVLRINPRHEEAREAYEELLNQFPNLAATNVFAQPVVSTPTPGATKPLPATETTDDDLAVSVDIDDLLTKTGKLNPRLAEPMKRPADAPDASDSYLDQIWATREKKAEPGTPATEDLEALFGGADVMDIPATPTEEEDLDAMFRGAKTPPRTPQRVENQALDDMLFGEEEGEDFGAPAAQDEADLDMGTFFPGFEAEAETAPMSRDFEEQPQAQAADFDADLDSFFTAQETPKEQPAEAPKQRGKQRGKPEPVALEDPFGQGEPAFVQEVSPAEAPKPRRGRERKPPPVKVEAEAPPPDPFEIERRANKRATAPRVLMLVALIAILAVGVLFVLSQRASAPGADAAQAAKEGLTKTGFQDVNAAQTGDVFTISGCSVPGLALQAKVFEAMDLVAVQVAKLRDTVKNAQIEVTMCGKTDVKLYRATAPIDAVVSYVDDNLANKSAYRASWQRN